MAALLLILALADAFWETKPPEQWSPGEVNRLLTQSPWGQMMGVPAQSAREASASQVQVYLASAAPAREAEKMQRRFSKRAASDPLYEEYIAFLEEDAGKSIILSIRMNDRSGMESGAETGRMEEMSTLRAGKAKLKLSGHFPPSSSDPYLRLVFPRQIPEDAKSLVFEVYLPGIPLPHRRVQFDLKEMKFRGKLEI
jgi:hypothetical protein